jgi:tRNA A-37 threonylcarbamoyl transferase component Bud32
LQAPLPKLLKKDIFGQITLMESSDGLIIRRDTRDAARTVRWIARRLLAREAHVLAALDGNTGVPQLIRVDRDTLDRTYVDGQPMQLGRPKDIKYFHAAAKLLRKLHRQNVVHNDLAKEPNLLLTIDGQPAFIDFQLAWFARHRGRLFRVLAREDIRHLLKHKRTYCADRLTSREKAILASPAIISRLWMLTVKPVYLFVTRRLLGWEDREGAGDRS